MSLYTCYYKLFSPPDDFFRRNSTLRVGHLVDLATCATCLVSSGGKIRVNSVALERNAGRSYCIRNVGNKRVLAGGHVHLGEQRGILGTIGNGTVQGKVIPVII